MNNDKYEEALAKAKRWYDANTNKGYREIFEDIFPELLESKYERIRKMLIELVKKHLVNHERCMAESWLEKQAKKLPVDWNEKRKGLDELETYILSLDPNRSLDAIKVDAKNIRFLVNKGYNDGFSASEYNRKMVEEDIRHNDNVIAGIGIIC